MSLPRILIAGLSGGGGKTVVSTGLAAAWRKKKLNVAPFKKGPDYIDAAWLTESAGQFCRNLDLFLIEKDVLLKSFVNAAALSDIAVIVKRASPLLSEKGQIVLWKGRFPGKEIDAAKAAIKKVSGAMTLDTKTYRLPLANAERTLVVIKKNA